MNILLSNDDGCQAPGLQVLAAELASIGNIHVVAPDRDRSGASNSLTLDSPLRARQLDSGFFCVDGTPTDCVHLAITGLLESEPDMVVSGINSGANMGDDVLYSGTVAAAMEGRFLGYPAIAVSLATERERPQYYTTAARVTLELVQRVIAGTLPADTILNVNVPDVDWEDLKGMQATRLGHRHKSEPVVKERDPRGRPVYWVGPVGPEQDAGPGTDFHAVRSGYVSITPLDVDLTRYDAIDSIASWLAE
jgi:5'-nucleotidase